MEVTTNTYEKLDDPIVEERYLLLDPPLPTALIKTVPPQLRKRIAKLEADALKSFKMVTGRQVAWMILDWFKTDIRCNFVIFIMHF